MFKNQLFYSDIHYGNFLIQNKEILCIMDFGCINYIDDELLKNRQLKRILFINSLLEKKGVKPIIWEVEKVWNDYETIAIATNNEIFDHHWSYKGHKDFAKYMLCNIHRPLT